MRRVRARRRANQQGMTLTELIVAVVLTGIVMLPIATALNVAITTPQQTVNRSTEATSRSIVTDQWSRDVGSAALVYLWKVGNHGTDPTVPGALRTGTPGQALQFSSTCPNNPPPAIPDEIAQFVWYDTSRNPSTPPAVSADYQLKYTFAQANPVAMKVELTRTLAGDANASENTTRTILSGYCLPGDTVLSEFADDTGTYGTDQYYGARRERASFAFRDSPSETPRIVNVEASTRPSCYNPNIVGATTTIVAAGAC